MFFQDIQLLRDSITATVDGSRELTRQVGGDMAKWKKDIKPEGGEVEGKDQQVKPEDDDDSSDDEDDFLIRRWLSKQEAAKKVANSARKGKVDCFVLFWFVLFIFCKTIFYHVCLCVL